MAKQKLEYFLVKIDRETFVNHEKGILEIGQVIYCGIDNEFQDNQELIDLNKRIKELRDKKEELLTKLRHDDTTCSHDRRNNT